MFLAHLKMPIILIFVVNLSNNTTQGALLYYSLEMSSIMSLNLCAISCYCLDLSTLNLVPYVVDHHHRTQIVIVTKTDLQSIEANDDDYVFHR